MTSPVPGLVSICIPSRNRRDLVLRAVRSSLAQTHSSVQVIVSDNASVDGSADALALIDDRRFQLIRQAENIGLVKNLNAVLYAAAGEFFILLSDDDLLDSDAVERLVQPMLCRAPGLSSGEIGLVWCPTTIIDAAGRPKYTTAAGPAHESSAEFMRGLYTGIRGPRLSSVLTRTLDAWQAGGYDEERLGALCDTGNWGSVALRYPRVVCVPQPLVKYTVHPASETSKAQCAEWRAWGHNMLDQHVAVLNARGDREGARNLERTRGPLLANLTATLLMRRFGETGWLKEIIAEGWRSRRFMLTTFTARRLVRDGWKMLRG